MTPDSVPAPAIKVSYRPRSGLGRLVLKNLLLNVLTLYIYSFWAKTNVRKHLWSCVTVMDEPLEYTGTGKELALGFVIVLVAIIVPFTAVQFAGQLLFADTLWRFAVDIFIALLVLFLVGIGTYRARRYRLSRTLWSGIRGTLTGSSLAYGARHFGMTLLLPVTLLWSYPWMSVTLTGRMTREMAFGNRQFAFTGGAAPLYGRFALLWLGTVGMAIVALVIMAFLVEQFGNSLTSVADGGIGAAIGDSDAASNSDQERDALLAVSSLVLGVAVIVTFVVVRSLYAAAELNYIAQCTAYGEVRFRMRATAGSVLGLFVVNVIIQVGTLGIATPFVQQRLIRYVCDRLTAHGQLDPASIRQSKAELDRTGEGIAEMFDVDAF